MKDRSELTTEHRNEKSMRMDQLPTVQLFDLINEEDATISGAIAKARSDICQAIERVTESFRSGGRLFYVGAGTSGRIGVLDATECPPTFLSESSQVIGIIAGGHEALIRSIEGAEDHPEDGQSAMDLYEVGKKDTVFGIATGGTTPFVHGAIQRAKDRGATTVFFACVSKDQVADEADVSIRVITGPEVLTGSTRMKAGTATKMVLNMITTIAMVQTGKVYQNLMVDANTSANVKLIDRGIRIIQTITGLSRIAANGLLEEADGRVKTALVMHSRSVGKQEAQLLLSEVNGNVGRILDS